MPHRPNPGLLVFLAVSCIEHFFLGLFLAILANLGIKKAAFTA
jgi:hypothetical protein